MFYNPQVSIDRINNQINELEKMKQNVLERQPTSINQTFQLSPSNVNLMRYANSLDEVNKELVVGDTPFFSKDMSVLWVKNIKGEVRAYSLEEIVQKDERDIQIELLQAQINEMKGIIEREQYNTNANAEQSKTNTTTNDDSIGESIEKSKPSSISRVSTSKKK